jgi:hypothetical protein
MRHADDRTDDDLAADHQLADLLRLAGRRPVPDAARMARAREAAAVEWRRVVHARGRWRWMRAALAAAVLAVGLGTLWLWSSRAALPAPVPTAAAPGPIAALRVVRGAAWIAVDGEAVEAPLAAGRGLRVGDRVRVGEKSGVAFEAGGRTSVRLDAGAAVTIRAGGRVDLVRGGLYVDADPDRPGPALTVGTPFGVITHTGTQFEVRVAPAALEVRVREGAVNLERGAARVTTVAGRALRVARDGTATERADPTSGPAWDWVTTMAAPFALDGATVPQFLRWVGRELGCSWTYADDATRRAAARTVLHGTIEGLGPDEALRVVLPAAGLTARRDGRRLIVSR